MMAIFICLSTYPFSCRKKKYIYNSHNLLFKEYIFRNDLINWLEFCVLSGKLSQNAFSFGFSSCASLNKSSVNHSHVFVIISRLYISHANLHQLQFVSCVILRKNNFNDKKSRRRGHRLKQLYRKDIKATSSKSIPCFVIKRVIIRLPLDFRRQVAPRRFDPHRLFELRVKDM